MLDVTLRWDVDGLCLEARAATPGRVRDAASTLAAWSNHPANRDLMGNSEDLSPGDVVDFYDDLRDHGGRPFVLFVDGDLAGDCDLRRPEGARAEFAIMVGDTSRQGKGLGTRFTVMTLVHAFRDLAMTSVSLAVLPHNTAGRRCYQKAGYEPDHAPATLAYLDSPGDVPMTVLPSAVRRLHPAAWADVVTLR